MRISVCLQSVEPPRAFEADAAEIEALGFDDLWLTDSSLHTRNCWSYLTLAARAAPGLALGTAVTNPLTRHPAITAAAAASLAEITEDRFKLGIGAGDRPLLSLGMKPAKLADLEASIGAIRGLIAGEHVDLRAGAFALEDAHYRFPLARPVPIWIAASGPRTLELAGRVADGVILLAGLHPDGLRYALEHIDRGVDMAGRSERPRITVFAYGAIDDEDPDRAYADGHTIAAWFPQTAPVYCELAGLDPALSEQVRASYRGGEFQEAAQAAGALPVDFVKRMCLAGTSEEARAHITAIAELGLDAVTVFPLGSRRMDTVRRFRRCFGDALGAAPAPPGGAGVEGAQP